MTDDDLARINATIIQLQAENIAQGFMITTLLGMAATATSDWRNKVDDLRIMTEWIIKNLVWEGSAEEGEALRSQALDYLQTSLDRLHAALVRREQDGHDRPPRPNSNPPSAGSD